MPSAAVDDDGTILAYLDSGPVEDRCYTTFVVVHGGSWFNGIFQRILKLAPKRGIRLICLNRRDFPGSTPYRQDEIAMIKEGYDAERFTQFRIARGQEIGRFIRNIVEKERLPPPRRKPDGGVEGGVALLGWSLGNSFTMALLAHMRSMHPTTATAIQEYLHTYVVFDAPHFIVGPEVPPGVEDTFLPQLLGQGSAMSPKEAAKFLSAYFAHQIDESGTTFQLAYEPEPGIPSTVSGMSPEELRSCVMEESPESEHLWRRAGALEGGFGADTQAVLFPGSGCEEWRPRIKWVYCDQSIWHSVWAAFRVRSEADRCGVERKTSIDIVRLRGGNHFVHWDYPEKMVELLEGCLE